MPSIKKAEYDRLKEIEKKYQDLRILQDKTNLTHFIVAGELSLCKKRLATSEECRDILAKTLEQVQWDADRWRRYYKASIETFRIEDTLEIPGCFKPQDSIEYIISKQEASDGSDHNA